MRTPLSSEHKAFFKKVGSRIRQYRKKFGVTQVELAELLGCSQQQIVSFEQGRTRLPLTALPPLAEFFGVTIEDLLGMSGKPVVQRPVKTGPPSKLEQQLEQVAKLPKSKRKIVSQMLEGLLQEAS